MVVKPCALQPLRIHQLTVADNFGLIVDNKTIGGSVRLPGKDTTMIAPIDFVFRSGIAEHAPQAQTAGKRTHPPINIFFPTEFLAVYFLYTPPSVRGPLLGHGLACVPSGTSPE